MHWLALMNRTVRKSNKLLIELDWHIACLSVRLLQKQP